MIKKYRYNGKGTDNPRDESVTDDPSEDTITEDSKRNLIIEDHKEHSITEKSKKDNHWESTENTITQDAKEDPQEFQEFHFAYFNSYMQIIETVWKQGDTIFLEPEMLWSSLVQFGKVLIKLRKNESLMALSLAP